MPSPHLPRRCPSTVPKIHPSVSVRCTPPRLPFHHLYHHYRHHHRRWISSTPPPTTTTTVRLPVRLHRDCQGLQQLPFTFPFSTMADPPRSPHQHQHQPKPPFADGQDIPTLSAEVARLRDEAGWVLDAEQSGLRKTYWFKTYTKVLVFAIFLFFPCFVFGIVAFCWDFYFYYCACFATTKV